MAVGRGYTDPQEGSQMLALRKMRAGRTAGYVAAEWDAVRGGMPTAKGYAS